MTQHSHARMQAVLERNTKGKVMRSDSDGRGSSRVDAGAGASAENTLSIDDIEALVLLAMLYAVAGWAL